MLDQSERSISPLLYLGLALAFKVQPKT